MTIVRINTRDYFLSSVVFPQRNVDLVHAPQLCLSKNGFEAATNYISNDSGASEKIILNTPPYEFYFELQQLDNRHNV